jgi:hypothetical protein
MIKKVLNEYIAFEAVEIEHEQNQMFVTPDIVTDKPSRGKVLQIGEQVPYVEIGDVIQVNTTSVVGPFKEDEQEFWLVPRSSVYFIL